MSLQLTSERSYPLATAPSHVWDTDRISIRGTTNAIATEILQFSDSVFQVMTESVMLRKQHQNIIIVSFVSEKSKFERLVLEWKEETLYSSSVSFITTVEAYVKIIGIGPNAVPLILAQLRSEGDNPDYWFTALRIITEADPVPPEDKGNMRKMASAWLRWGEQSGII